MGKHLYKSNLCQYMFINYNIQLQYNTKYNYIHLKLTNMFFFNFCDSSNFLPQWHLKKIVLMLWTNPANSLLHLGQESFSIVISANLPSSGTLTLGIPDNLPSSGTLTLSMTFGFSISHSSFPIFGLHGVSHLKTFFNPYK